MLDESDNLINYLILIALKVSFQYPGYNLVDLMRLLSLKVFNNTYVIILGHLP